MYKQNLSVMSVASCRSTFLCLMSRVCLVPFRISVRDWIPFSGRACRGFRSALWPSLAWSSPLRPARPWRPLPSPCARPLPPPDPFVSFDFSRAVTSLSLFHLSLSPWCPRVWSRHRRNLDPRAAPSPAPGERPPPGEPLPGGPSPTPGEPLPRQAHAPPRPSRALAATQRASRPAPRPRAPAAAPRSPRRALSRALGCALARPA